MERAGFWADRIGLWLLPAALLAGVAYFTFHAFQGKYGLVARDEQLALIERLDAQRTELDREIAALELKYFGPDMRGTGVDVNELRGVIERWSRRAV